MTVIPKGYIITDKCCDKTRFYDSRDDFPETGLVSRLYVDRETGIVYVWDGSEYITADTPDRFHFFNTSVSNYNPSLPLAGWTQPTPLEGATATIQFAGGTEVNYTSDGITWNVNFVNAEYRAILGIDRGSIVELNKINTMGFEFNWAKTDTGAFKSTFGYDPSIFLVLLTAYDENKVYFKDGGLGDLVLTSYDSTLIPDDNAIQYCCIYIKSLN